MDSINSKGEKKYEAAINIVTVIYVATLFILYYVLYNHASVDPDNNTSLENMANVFYGSAAASAIMSFIFPRLTAKEHQKRFADDPNRVKALFIPYILSIALSESVAVLGFVSSYVTRNQQHYLILGACGFALTIFHYLNVKKKIKNIKTTSQYKQYS